MSDHDTSMEADAVCPYCGHRHTQADLCDRNACSEDQRTITCDHCEKSFHVIGSVRWHFSTYKTAKVT